jgi:hypothetical protein
MNIKNDGKRLQSTSKEENEKGGIISRITFNILINPEPSLVRPGWKRVGPTVSEKRPGPRWGLTREVIGGEFRKGVESEERKEC